MANTRLEIENLDKYSVADLIETAQQLEVGLLANDLLPPAWKNPGVAGLVAYRLIADQLKNKDLSPPVTKFLEKIEECSNKALSELEAKGSAAFIKPIINKLMEHESGFQKTDYSEHELTSLKKIAHEEKFSMEGQLAYHKANKRFFLIVDDRYRQILKGKVDAPKSWLNNAHCSLNDGMDISESQKLFEQYEKEVGQTTQPIFRVEDSKVDAEMVYLNKTIHFTIEEAAIGIPKTNSQMQKIHTINIQSPIIDELKKKGIFCPYPGYKNHITIGEARRKPHFSLNKGMPLSEILDNGSVVSNRLQGIMFSPTPRPTVDMSTDHTSKLVGYGAKLHSGRVQLWSFNKPDSTPLEKNDEIRSNQVYRR